MRGQFKKHSHTHRDEKGVLHRCFHQCKHWLSPGFLIGWLVASTITFMPEHTLWEKVWPFYAITNWMEHLGRAPNWLSAIIDLLWLLAIGYGIWHYASRSKS